MQSKRAHLTRRIEALEAVVAAHDEQGALAVLLEEILLAMELNAAGLTELPPNLRYVPSTSRYCVGDFERIDPAGPGLEDYLEARAGYAEHKNTA